MIGELRFALFDTALGRCGVAWSDRGLARVQLPEGDEDETRRCLASRAVEARPLSWVARAIRRIVKHLGANPFALVVPCHRVVAAGGRMGGFSAHGGAATKARLLAIEGVAAPASLRGVAPRPARMQRDARQAVD